MDTAERPEDIDLNRAEIARAKAEERLQQKISEREYKLMQMALARALARIKLSNQDRQS